MRGIISAAFILVSIILAACDDDWSPTVRPDPDMSVDAVDVGTDASEVVTTDQASTCLPTPENWEECSDGFDNDCDGRTDQDDLDCEDVCDGTDRDGTGGCDDQDGRTEDWCNANTWRCESQAIEFWVQLCPADVAVCVDCNLELVAVNAVACVWVESSALGGGLEYWADADEDGRPEADPVSWRPSNFEADNCPEVANPDQLDSDGNGVGDACQ